MNNHGGSWLGTSKMRPIIGVEAERDPRGTVNVGTSAEVFGCCQPYCPLSRAGFAALTPGVGKETKCVYQIQYDLVWNMTKLFISLGIGALAGILDIIPMVLQKLDRFSNLSAFVHWLVLGVIISYIQLPLSPWLKGLVIAELSSLPIVILVMKNDIKSVVPILVMSAILGIAVGVASNRFAS